MLQYNVTFGTTWVARPSTQSIMFSTGCHRCSRRCRCVPSVSLSLCVCVSTYRIVYAGSMGAILRQYVPVSSPHIHCQYVKPPAIKSPVHEYSSPIVARSLTHMHMHNSLSLSLSFSFAFSQMASSFSSLFSSSQRSASSAGDLSSVPSCDAQL